MTAGRPGAGEVIAALALIRRELEAISAQEHGDEKTSDIRDLAKALQDLYETAAGMRTAVMLRIYDEERLSLAPLADRVGVSKARAHQAVQARDRDREKGKRDA